MALGVVRVAWGMTQDGDAETAEDLAEPENVRVDIEADLRRP